ncbi:phage antirepressor KilAC domain-containing protein [Prevotella histicola]|uniref:phage antirepressor KilAC domain-containing protein n=1 Tax=Prevotella histicola TaxID=470565 RepID=UPI000690C624|nr:phage antirepressor KilAC domain-containing protein [Prevotella histicola]
MNDVTIFSSNAFGSIRTGGTSDNPLFCLADVCKALKLSAKGVNQRLNKEVISNYPLQTAGGVQHALFVNEDGLYDVILDSRKPEAKAFRKWITSEVLPSIRKSGGYIASTQDDSPELIMARALQVAQATIDRHKHQLEQANERIALQSTQLKQQAPKVKYVDELLQSVNTYTSTQMSKELGMKDADRLHKALREKGVMFKQSGQWMLTAKYCGHDYTKTRTHQFTRSDGSTGTNAITVWTEKGRAFLHNTFNIQIIKEIA